MASPSPSSIPESLVKVYAQALGVPEDQARAQLQAQAQQAQGANTFAPFALQGNADQGTLYLGSTPADMSFFPGLPDTRPKGNQTQTINYLGNNIRVTTPHFGRDYHVELHTTWGHLPSRDEIAKASEDPSSVQMFVQIKDKHGKVVANQMLDQTEVQSILSRAPGTSGHPAIGAGHNLGGDVNISLDPYQLDSAGRIGGTPNNEPGVPLKDQTGMIEDQLKSLYNMDPKQLAGMKHELWLAGYYGNGTPLSAVNMNSITNDDISAFGTLMTGAARYYAAGKKITWQDLLHQEASDPSVKAKTGQPAIPLTDPAAITQQANATATKILGRAPSPEDVSTLIKLIHSQETNYGQTQQQTSGGTVVRPDPTADIEQYLRQHYPNEAMAVDWGSAAQQWDSMLASTSPQPQIVSPTHG